MSDRTSFPLVFALWGAGLGAAGQYAKISVIFDRLPAMYPDAGAALGFTVSLVGFLGILLGVMAGLVVARIRYRRAMLWGLWAGAVLSLYQATLPSLPLMLLSRALEGVSHLALVVAAPTLIAQLSAERHRGFTLTLWSTFFSVAFTLLVALGLPLVDAMGVPALFVAHAIWLAAFAVILGLFLRPLEVPPEGTLSFSGILRDHAAIYRSPSIAAPGGGLDILYVLFPGNPDRSTALHRAGVAGLGHGGNAVDLDCRVAHARCLCIALRLGGHAGADRFCTEHRFAVVALGGSGPACRLSCVGRGIGAGAGRKFCRGAPTEPDGRPPIPSLWRFGANRKSGQHAGHTCVVGSSGCGGLSRAGLDLCCCLWLRHRGPCVDGGAAAC